MGRSTGWPKPDDAPLRRRACSRMRFPLADSLYVLDIGARYGLQWPWSEWREQVAPVLVEPEEAEYRRLRQRYQHVLNVALADTEGSRTLYVARGAGKSSLYKPNAEFLEQFPKPERFETVATQQVRTTTLDALAAAGELPRIDAVKVDVQGAELDILRGGERVLGEQALALEIEVCFDEMYEGYPRFCAVDQFVTGLGGLHLQDLSKRHWRYARGAHLGGKGRLVFGDALYLAGLERTMNRPDAETGVLKASLIALAYGFPDYALHLLNGSGLSGAVKDAARFVERYGRRRLGIPSRALRRGMRKLAAFFPPAGDDGSVGARRLFGRYYW
jgi:FkbM family methyltransferase